MSVHVYGIRHHGPGCARSLLAALRELQPDVLLVEGPPDAEKVLPLIADESLNPPVALLVYQSDKPMNAAFYPFAAYSPEWQALRFTFERGIPARFMDLPQSVQLAQREAMPDTSDAPKAGPQPGPDARRPTLRDDPIGALAEVAGYTDHELWWEHQVEQRQNVTGLFDAILEAMSALREDAPASEEREAQREAYMRRTIRTAQKEGYERIAVVCGAWHAPALAKPGLVKSDQALLSRLPKVKTLATWIPWTNSRLSYRSGYGAGVASPGWYEHLWHHGDNLAVRWAARAAGLLRSEGLDAPSSNVIEAARLAEALAAMRDLPMPGLMEVNEAIQVTVCNGERAPMLLIRDKLEIGEALGAVPENVPSVPLQQDLLRQQKRLRLKPSTESGSLDLDLRNETDRARSHLLRRLRLLGVEWGTPQRVAGKTGTFHELWVVQWHPEFEVRLIEASAWGNTVEAAATERTRDAASKASDLPDLTDMLDTAILADLPDAIAYLLGRVRAQAAVAADVRHLMNALPPLARIVRYGDVRGTSSERVMPVIEGLFERTLVGLPGACYSLDEDAATEMVESISRAQECVSLLNDSEQRAEWTSVLREMLEDERINALVRGWCCRLLVEQQALDNADLERLANLALSPVVPADHATAWLGGALRGSGMLLLHHDGLWVALDRWLMNLREETFTEMLPLVRRAFSDFQPAERRAMGEKVRHLHADGELRQATEAADSEADEFVDAARADRTLPVLARILGVSVESGD